jgi:two-component system, NarL family, response regulator LiaR
MVYNRTGRWKFADKRKKSAMGIRVVIADDHAMLCAGLRMFLQRDPEITVVGEARDGGEAIELVRALKPDVVLMDVMMSPVDGITATSVIKREWPDVEVVALTSILDDAWITRAIRAGAIGYLLKNTDPDELCRAVRAAGAGQVTLSPAVASRLVEEVRWPEKQESLSQREIEVLRLVAAGQSNKEIAQQLNVEENTVRTHVHNILRKLNLSSRTQAALHALRTGLVSSTV